jgi:hypothetical protein
MPGEGILTIGATVDKTGVEAGLVDIQNGVKEAVQSVAVQVEETTARTKAAWNKLGADVKAAAQSVSAESLKVAEATKAQAAALADLRRASVLARDTKLDEAASTAILAAAQQKAAAASSAVAAAKQAEAETVNAANTEEVLSENSLVASFQRAGAAIGESLAGVRERLVLTGETAHITARDMTGAFSGLGELLGIGLLAGFAGNYLDELAKMNVELDHLATETGMNITNLAGLQQIVKEMGGEWEPIATGLTRMNKNLNDAIPPTTELTQALAGINLKIADLKGLSPEEKLEKISIAFAGTSNAANRTAAAYALFGRGGVALVPILVEQGAQLEANMKKTGALTGVTDESAIAARRWTQDVARLTAQFRSVMIPVMEHAEDVIRAVVGVFDAGAFVLVSGFELVATAIVAAIGSLAKFGLLVADIFTGNWSAVKNDVQNVVSAFTGAWKDGFEEIKRNWQVVAHDFTYSTPIPKLEPGDFAGNEGMADPHALRNDERELNELKLKHRLSLDEEKDFWRKKLATAQKGSDEYYGIEAKLADLSQRKPASGSAKKDLTADEAELTRLLATHKLTIDEEESFWRKKLAVNKGGFDEYVQILKKIELAKEAQKGPQTENADISIPEDELTRAVKANKDAVKQTLDADRFGAEEKMRIAAEEYRDIEENAAFEVRMGRMSAEQRLQVLRQAALEEQRIRQQQSQFIQMLDLGDSRRYLQDLRQEEQAARESARTITQLSQQASLDFVNKWNRAMQSFNQGFRRVISETITGTKSIGQSFAQMFNGIIVDLADMVAQWLLKEAEKWAMLHVMQALGIGQQKTTQAAANVTTVTGDAAVAAAGALAYYSAINPPAAPALAAAQFAMTMAYAPMAAFAEGGVVNGQRGMGVPILAHAGERVLTPGQTENFHKLVNQTTNSASSSQKLEMHLQQNIHAYDRSGMRNTLRAHADDLMDIVQDGIRSGKLKYA